MANKRTKYVVSYLLPDIGTDTHPSYSRTFSPRASIGISPFSVEYSSISLHAVPLATLVCATEPPSSPKGAILSPEGKKRFFVVHGGLFSKDGVTLDEIRKIERIGRQPGTEGLMCTCDLSPELQ